MWPLDSLSPKFTVSPENDYAPWELQQNKPIRKTFLLQEGSEFLHWIGKQKSFFSLTHNDEWDIHNISNFRDNKLGIIDMLNNNNHTNDV